MKLTWAPAVTTAAVLAGVLLAGCTASEPAGETQSAPSTGVPSPTPTRISGTYTGTQVFELGTPPEKTSHVDVELTCIDPGVLSLPDGSSAECGGEGHGAANTWTLPVSPGENSLEVTASDPEISYQADIKYAKG